MTQVIPGVAAPYQSPEKIRHAQAVYSADHRRLGFFDGEVRPGEAVLKQFTVRAPSRRFYMSHGQRHRPQFAPIDEIFLKSSKDMRWIPLMRFMFQ